jgi:hypothetical protein
VAFGVSRARGLLYLMAHASKPYKTRRALGEGHRRGLRAYLSGTSSRASAIIAGLSPSTFAKLVSSPAGRAFLARERDRIDAHRVLLSASLPMLALLEHARAGVTIDKGEARRIKDACARGTQDDEG